jgi:hydrogenase expression/formation protein HypD
VGRIDAAYRDPEVVRRLVAAINRELADISLPAINFMEVCGTHTMAIFRSGIRSLLPPRVNMLSGPGCPVCVTAIGYLDRAIETQRKHDVILTTFGDMMKVPGSYTTLEREKAGGADIRTVYSPMDALEIARANPGRQIVFLAVGFETTAPGIASTVVMARHGGVSNFSILSAHKVIPPALMALLSAPDINIQGFMLPGHVSVVLGVEPYRPVAEQGKVPCVITGFQPVDMLQCIYMLLKQLREGRHEVEIEYTRVVRPEGNAEARAVMADVFKAEDADWRGVGVIPGSGMGLAARYSDYDAVKRFPVTVPPPVEPKGCICGEVLRGVRKPTDCKLFGKVCTPASAVGACMVSSEGTCAAYYRFHTVAT